MASANWDKQQTKLPSMEWGEITSRFQTWGGSFERWRSCRAPFCVGTRGGGPPWPSSPPLKCPGWQSAEWSSRSYPTSSWCFHPRFLSIRKTKTKQNKSSRHLSKFKTDSINKQNHQLISYSIKGYGFLPVPTKNGWPTNPSAWNGRVEGDGNINNNNDNNDNNDNNNNKWEAPSAPMETSLTPLLAMKSRALLTLAILWKRILPRSGLGSVSPEITSRSSISFRPLRKSSSMLSMPVPALRRCELHHAVNVYSNK